MHILSFAMDIVLAGYIAWEVVRFIPRYRQLKQAIANGDAQARTPIYYQALAFEWISAFLALVALGFDWSKLNPKSLALEASAFIRHFSLSGEFGRGIIGGVLFGIAVGLVGMMLARVRANRRGIAPAPDSPAPRWRRLLPDFSALVPVTTRERFLWVAVAVSAGVCEETVFRGWLLATLHSKLGLAGTALLLVASAIFGLAHAYQGITGVILTGLAGAFFCGLYVATGSLLVPILLHALIDLRFALLPSPRAQKPRAAYA
jgi:uncharacterized protein